jgi:hypothetical protein
MSAFYVVRPTGAWLEPATPASKRRSRYTFKASWSDTIDLLERELRHLRARDVVLQLDVQERDIRMDGMLRANATPQHPGVRISFESVHGPLTYATDSCAYWQHNVRSIALGLEALRAVDRYGVTKRGEQYAGWKALPAGAGDGASHMTRDAALALINEWTPGSRMNEPLERRVRWAKACTHPDRHDGDRQHWDRVELAATVRGVRS